MNFFYQSGARGFYGEGYAWHDLFKLELPFYPMVTKTMTLEQRDGTPFLFVHLWKSVWNKNALSNFGVTSWHLRKSFSDKPTYSYKDIIVSLSGTDNEIQVIINQMFEPMEELGGIELNYSCPNVGDNHNKKIPKTKHNLQIKLNHLQNPYDYDGLDRIKRITLNSVPMWGGGVSGSLAQKKNWAFIERYQKNLNIPIAGCSWICEDDIKRLYEYYGCAEFGIGSVMLINPKLVCRLPELFPEK